MARILLAHVEHISRPVLDVALSERNLMVLLSKLYTPGAESSLRDYDVPAGFDHAVIRAEPDELHYASPTRNGSPAGPMPPLAELVHDTVRRALEHALRGDGDGLVTLFDLSSQTEVR